MRTYSLWGVRILPVLLALTLFIPFLSPFCFTDEIMTNPETGQVVANRSPLSLATSNMKLRPSYQQVREEYTTIVYIYTGEIVGQTAYLADLVPVVCYCLFIAYGVMILGGALTFSKKESLQNGGARVVKIASFFAIGINVLILLITYSTTFTLRGEDGPGEAMSAVEFGLVDPFPLGLIITFLLVLLTTVSAYIFNYINTQSMRAAMKILASSRPVENPGKRLAFRILCYAIACIVAVMFLVPFYFTFINAIRFMTNPPTTAWPVPAHFENFVYAITRIPFFDYLSSTLIILGISLSLQIVMNYIYAFAFARLQAPGREFLFGIVVTLMMVPGIAMQIPQFVLFSGMGVANTFWIWFLLGLSGTPRYIFLYRQFMQGLPKELEESAKLDGCNLAQIMIRIFVPITAPVIATVFMFEFLNAYGNVTLPFMYLDQSKWPLCGALQGIRYTLPNTANVMEPLVMAFTVLFIIPSICVYVFGQKYLREGMITSGLKG